MRTSGKRWTTAKTIGAMTDVTGGSGDLGIEGGKSRSASIKGRSPPFQKNTDSNDCCLMQGGNMPAEPVASLLILWTITVAYTVPDDGTAVPGRARRSALHVPRGGSLICSQAGRLFGQSVGGRAPGIHWCQLQLSQCFGAPCRLPEAVWGCHGLSFLLDKCLSWMPVLCMHACMHDSRSGQPREKSYLHYRVSHVS